MCSFDCYSICRVPDFAVGRLLLLRSVYHAPNRPQTLWSSARLRYGLPDREPLILFTSLRRISGITVVSIWRMEVRALHTFAHMRLQSRRFAWYASAYLLIHLCVVLDWIVCGGYFVADAVFYVTFAELLCRCCCTKIRKSCYGFISPSPYKSVSSTPKVESRLNSWIEVRYSPSLTRINSGSQSPVFFGCSRCGVELT